MNTMTTTIGSYLATRLERIGLRHHFVVPGDYNLVLLYQLLLNKKMQQVSCCNELDCSYSAEGYARANGAAACVVTYSVGALSAFDGLGSAYAENLPVILISGNMQLWPDAGAGLREIARVVRGGGRVALGFTPYSGQPKSGVAEALAAAGFTTPQMVQQSENFCGLATKS